MKLHRITTNAGLCALLLATLLPMIPPAASAGETPSIAPTTAFLKMPQALSAAGFQRFAAMIQAAGLAGALEAEGPFTCFAPADEAFDALPEERRKFFEENPKDESVIRWIQYHFVADEALDHAALGGIRGAVTMDGRFITVWVTPEAVRMDKVSPIVRPDLKAANGVIHGISQPLSPKEPTEEPAAKG